MLEWLIGQFAKLLWSHARVRTPFFPYMLVFYHIKEIKYRLIYLLISLIVTYLIILNFNSYILLMFSPNIKTFMLFSNIIDNILIKWSFAFYLTLLFTFPYVLFSLWSFVRPGLFTFEDWNLAVFIFLTVVFPILLYNIIITLYNYYIIEIVEYSNRKITQNTEIYIPTLGQIVLLIKNIIKICLFITVLIISSIYFNFFNFIFYTKHRPIIWFTFLLIFTLILPPDVLVLLITSVIIIITLELIYIWNLARLAYKSATH